MSVCMYVCMYVCMSVIGAIGHHALELLRDVAKASCPHDPDKRLADLKALGPRGDGGDGAGGQRSAEDGLRHKRLPSACQQRWPARPCPQPPGAAAPAT